jgi:hypothetical protein
MAIVRYVLSRWWGRNGIAKTKPSLRSDLGHVLGDESFGECGCAAKERRLGCGCFDVVMGFVDRWVCGCGRNVEVDVVFDGILEDVHSILLFC